MTPSIKTLQTRLSISRDTAKQVRGIMDGSLDPETIGAVQRWVAQCFNRPSSVELKLCAIDSLLETHGVEGIVPEDQFHAVYLYCNTGDTYAATVVYDTRKGHFLVCDWGTLVEQAEG